MNGQMLSNFMGFGASKTPTKFTGEFGSLATIHKFVTANDLVDEERLAIAEEGRLEVTKRFAAARQRRLKALTGIHAVHENHRTAAQRAVTNMNATTGKAVRAQASEQLNNRVEIARTEAWTQALQSAKGVLFPTP